MGQGSAGFFEDDAQDNADALPLTAEDRASQSLRSPAFQQAAPPAPDIVAAPTEPAPQPSAQPNIPEPQVVSDTPDLPQEPAPLLHRRYSDPNVEAQKLAHDQQIEAHQQREYERSLTQAGVQGFAADGAPVFKPTVGAPSQGPDGNWYRDLQDDTGKVTRFSMDDARLARADRMRIDPATGEKYFEHGGLRVAAGTDQPTVDRLNLLSDRRALAAQDRTDRAQMAVERESLQAAKEKLRAFGSTPRQFETSIKNLTLTGATDEASTARLKANQDAYAKWQADHPEYAKARAEADLYEANLSTREQGIIDRRLRAAALMGKPAAAALAGSVPDVGTLPVVHNGDADAKGVAAFSTLAGLQKNVPPATAHLETLKLMQSQGAKTVGGQPIEAEISKLQPLATKEQTPPEALDTMIEKPAFKALDGDAKISMLKQWVDDTARFNRYADPKFDEKAFRGQFVDRGGAWGFVEELGAGLKDALINRFPQDLAGIWRSGDITSLKDQTWADRLYSNRQKSSEKEPVSLQYLAGGQLAKGAKEGPASVATSVAVGIPAFLTGAKAGAIVGAAVPGAGETGLSELAGAAIGGTIGAATGSGAAFYRLGEDQFVSQLRDQFAKDHPDATDAEWNAFRTSPPVQGAMRKYGLIEGGVEAGSEAITAGLFHGGGALAVKMMAPELIETLAKAAVKTTARRGAKIIGQLALEQGQEVGTETLQQKWESDIEAQFGLRARGQTYGEAFADVAAPTLMGATIQTGAHRGIEYLRSKAPQVAEKQSRDFSQIASDYSDALAKAETARDAGDLAGHAEQTAAADRLLQNAHDTAMAARQTVADPARKALAKIADPEGDFEGQEKALTQDPSTGFAAAEIGQALRDAYVGPDREAKVQHVSTAMNVPAELASTIVDQHTAFAAARDLQAVLDGGGIDQAKAQGLQALGLLEVEPQADGTVQMRVTDDALPLLPQTVRQAIAASPKAYADTFTVTPGPTGNGWARLVRSGMQRMAAGLQRNATAVAVPPVADAPNAADPISAGEKLTGNLAEDVPSVIRTWVQRFGHLFEAVEEKPESIGSGGFAVSQDGKSFTVYMGDIWREVQATVQRAQAAGVTREEATAQALTRIRTMLDEELRHVADIRANTDEETAALWDALPDSLKVAARAIYTRERGQSGTSAAGLFASPSDNPFGITADDFAPAHVPKMIHSSWLEGGNKRRLRAATKQPSGKIDVGELGGHHFQLPSHEGSIFGFVTPDGQFITREEASALIRGGALGASGATEGPVTGNPVTGMSSVQWGREFKRMLSQGDNISELADVTLKELRASGDTTLAGRILAHIRNMLAWLKGSEAADAVRQLQRLESELSKITGESTETTVTTPAPGATVRSDENRRDISGDAGSVAPNNDAANPVAGEQPGPDGNADGDRGTTSGSVRAAGQDQSGIPEKDRPLSELSDSEQDDLRGSIAAGFDEYGAVEDSPWTRSLALRELTGAHPALPVGAATIGDAIDAGLIESFEGMLVPTMSSRQRAMAEDAQADAERELRDHAMAESGHTSLLEAVIAHGGIAATGKKLGKSWGEEARRVVDALKAHNDRVKKAGGKGTFPAKLFNKNGLSPDEFSHEHFGGKFGDGNEFLAELEAELATGKTHWVMPDQGGDESHGRATGTLQASRSRDTNTLELDLDGLKAAPVREQSMAKVWQRLTKKRTDGVKLTAAEEEAYLMAEKELGQKYLVDLGALSDGGNRALIRTAEDVATSDDPAAAAKLRAAGLLASDVTDIAAGALRPAAVPERLAKRREQATARAQLQARAQQRLTVAAMEDQRDMFSGHPEDRKGNGLLFASPSEQEYTPTRDRFTGADTIIGGRTVSVAAAAAVSAAERERAQRADRTVARLAAGNDGAPGEGRGAGARSFPGVYRQVGSQHVEEIAAALGVPLLDSEQAGRLMRLPKLTPGAEGIALRDDAEDVVYKAYTLNAGRFGYAFVIDENYQGAKAMRVPGDFASVVQKAMVLSHLGTPTEVVALLRNGAPVTKQPLADQGHKNELRAQWEAMGAVHVPWTGDFDVRGEDTYIANIGGDFYILNDAVQTRNVRSNTLDQARAVDAITGRLHPEDLALSRTLREAAAKAKPLNGAMLFASSSHREAVDPVRAQEIVEEFDKGDPSTWPADLGRGVEEPDAEDRATWDWAMSPEDLVSMDKDIKARSNYDHSRFYEKAAAEFARRQNQARVRMEDLKKQLASHQYLYASRTASTGGDWTMQDILPMEMTPGGNATSFDISERNRLQRLPAIAFESATDALERSSNPVALQGARKLRDYTDERSRALGKLESPFENILAGKNAAEVTKAKKEWDGYWRAKENKRGAEATALLHDMSPLGKQLVGEWLRAGDITGKAARAIGIQVFDQDLNEGRGGYRPMGKVAQYFPRMLRKEVWDVIDNPDSNPKLRKELEAALVASGYDPAKARAFFDLGAPSLFDRNDFFGALEQARKMQLPEAFYEYDFAKVVPSYLEKFAQRYAQIKTFGQKLEQLPPTDPRSKDFFDKLGKEAANGATATWVQALKKQVYGIQENTPWNKFASNLRALTSGILLANPFTTVPRNVVSGLYSTAELFGAGRSFAAMKNILAGTLSKNTAVSLGILRGGIADAAQYLDPEMNVSSVIRKFTNAALKISGYNASEEFLRRHCAAAGMVFVNDYLNSPPNGKLAQQAESFMRRIGIDPAAVRAERGDFANGQESRRFIRQAVKEAQFGYDVDQVPLWGNTPNGRFFYQFGRWGTQRTRTLWKHVFEPALFGEWKTISGKRYRVRNVAPLSRMVATLPLRTAVAAGGFIATGEIFAAIAGMFFDRDRDDASLTEIARTADESRLKALEKLAGRALNDVMTGGMLGILGQPLDFYRSWFQGSRFKNPIEPPVSAVPKSLGELLLSLKERGLPISLDDFVAGDLKDLNTAAGSMMPGVAAAEGAAGNLAAKLGLHIHAIEVQEAKVGVKNLRKAARRFADENGLEAGTGGVFSRVAKTPHTATYDRVSDALLIGDFAAARAAADEYLATVPDADRQKAERSLKMSVKQREPVKVGPFHSAEVKTSFLEWAAKNLPVESVREIQRLQSTYEQSAAMAGF